MFSFFWQKLASCQPPFWPIGPLSVLSGLVADESYSIKSWSIAEIRFLRQTKPQDRSPNIGAPWRAPHRRIRCAERLNP
jgi:hypothetical protein